MTKPRNPKTTAIFMIEKYGMSRAAEYAYGYAVGMYFNQTPAGKEYWLKVSAEIKALTRRSTVRLLPDLDN